MAGQIHELDVVVLTGEVDGWPAGTSGTVVDLSDVDALVEIDARTDDGDAVMLDVPLDALRVVHSVPA